MIPRRGGESRSTPKSPVRPTLRDVEALRTMEAVVSDECDFAECNDPPTVEAIGTYDGVFGIEETVALALCRRHADALRDDVLLLEVA
jgi:hypothetical protein